MAVGREFGPYTLLRKLARGGMADIFLARRRHEVGDELCVIKMMLPHTLRNPRAIKLFLGEARLITHLEHPNIVRIQVLDRVDNYFFIAMEYIPGETAFHLLHQACEARRPVRPEEAAGIVWQTCQGLHYAHELCDDRGQPLRLVHRDISPSNLMISYDGQVKILDFGIAAAVSRSRDLPPNRTLGKYGYMSPEQYRGQVVDRRSDIFSLGVVLWELCTGSALFPGSDPAQIRRAALEGRILTPREVNLNVPEALESVAMVALERDPKRRFRDAAEMGLALQEACGEALADEARLSQMLREIFGPERERMSRAGEVGAELELETLLFDDLGTSDGEALRPEAQPLRRRVLRPATLAWLILSLLLIGAALALRLLVDAMDPVRPPRTEPAPQEGTIQVDSNPRGAAIFLNGRDTGLVTPAELRRIPLATDQDIELRRAGYMPFRSRVRLENDAPRRISAALVREPKAPRK
ncbi:MAG: protein kinase [Myxococcales bacterium]|nr:protein kinase [Myxococcales bacterium]